MSLFSWFHRRQRVRSTDSFHVQQIKFVGKQDGAPEQELTGRLTQLFQNASTVKKAYLARGAVRDGRATSDSTVPPD